jgi:hypothetical protein
LGAVETLARIVHVLLLAIWFGGGLLFLAIFAPNVFHTVPSRDIAGNLITATLAEMDLFGTIAGPVLLVTLFAGWSTLRVPLKFRAALTVLMTLATVVSGYWLTPEMLRLRHAMNAPIEEVATTDPLRVSFARLHSISTGVMIGHLAVALLLLIYAVAAASPKRKPGIEL